MKNSIAIIVVFFCCIGYSQTGFVKGKVLDKSDNSVLIGVNILFGENQGAATNVDGEYSLALSVGDHSITFQYIGYKTETINVNIQDAVTETRNIYLKTETTEMDLVVVSAGKFEQKLEEVTVSMDVIKPT